MAKRTSRDNIGGIKARGFKQFFLFPGMVIQWVQYMTMAGEKSYGKVRTHTRLSRSPLMTWVYSFAFWVFLALYAHASVFVDQPSPETVAAVEDSAEPSK